MKKEDIKRGRKLSLLLRHQPDLLKLKMNSEGWVELNELIDAWGAKDWSPGINLDVLKRLVDENDKKRYTLDLENSRIRARQGHSVSIDLGLEPVIPPEKLFHGTVSKFLESIKVDGLIKGRRQHVHLSLDLKTANKVGQRRGKPVILSVNSEAMHHQGFKFYLSDNDVWLAEAIPAEFIEFP
jgi:putative RNA 2'-phosphotransferase